MATMVKRKASRPKFILDQSKPTKPMQIVYHGTTEANAKKILEHGFKPGTFFALHLEDSIGFGGNYIFEVAVESDTVKGTEWEFITNDRVPPSQIIELKHYPNARSITENKELGEAVFRSNLPKADLNRILAREASQRIHKMQVESIPLPIRKLPSRIARGVGYIDKGGKRLARRHCRGWRRIY